MFVCAYRVFAYVYLCRCVSMRKHAVCVHARVFVCLRMCVSLCSVAMCVHAIFCVLACVSVALMCMPVCVCVRESARWWFAFFLLHFS